MLDRAAARPLAMTHMRWIDGKCGSGGDRPWIMLVDRPNSVPDLTNSFGVSNGAEEKLLLGNIIEQSPESWLD